MADSSDGKHTPKIPGGNLRETRKPRKISLGPSLSESDICKVNKTGHPAIKNNAGQSKQQQLPGSVQNFDSDPNFESNYEDVFEPKNTTTRTPPILNADLTTQVNKRGRSDTTPEEKNTRKRICEENTKTSQIPEGDVNKAQKLSVQIINDFFNAVGHINNITSEKPDKNGDLIVSETQISLLKQTQLDISRMFTLLIFQNGEIEKENVRLKYKLNEIMPTKISTSEPDPLAQNKTYSEIAAYKAAKAKVRTEQSKETLYDEDANQEYQWETPKTRKKIETIIRMENITDPKHVMQLIKEEINQKNKEIKAFKNIRQTTTGAIIIESFDKEQQQKLKNVIDSNEKFKLKESEPSNPMFMITGIEKGYSESEFLQELIRLNHEIIDELQIPVGDKIKVVAKKQCINPSKENWILQAPPTISKWFIKRRTVYFDLLKVYVQEHINLAMCFKCSGFDHVAKYCTQNECCYRCSQNHNPRECSTEDLKCPNCTKMRYKVTDHTARDPNCPVLKKRKEKFRGNINYEDFQESAQKQLECPSATSKNSQ